MKIQLNSLMWQRALLVPFTIALTAIAACPESDDDDDDDDVIEPVCTELTEVECRDETLVDLAMNINEVSDGAIENTAQDEGFLSIVDATAGGAFGGDEGYVYGKFTADGLERVELDSDDASFDSLDWDIAFRRFVIRLNSGDGGPSCVTAANLGEGTPFADVSSIPDGAQFNKEDFMTADCSMIPDGSGLETAPGVVLQSYWDYTGCLGMTHNVYAIELADGHHVKFEVLAYYAPDAQEECNSDPSSTNFTGSANLRMQWAFLD